VVAISKWFELESWDWAHSLFHFELFPIVIKYLVVRGKGGGVAGWSKSAPNLLKFLQGVLLMYWAYIPSNELVIAKNSHLNPF
jgi:hypothetical protein